MCCTPDTFLAFLAILFPPLPVWVKRGICSADSIINIALCMLGFIPGLLHAWYIIAKYPEDFQYGALDQNENGSGGPYRVYYIPGCGPQINQSRQSGGCVHYQQEPATPQGYNTFPGQQNVNKSSNAGPETPTQYTHCPQETDEAVAGSSTHPGGNEPGLPSYADVVKGDFKVQSQE